VLNQNKDNVGIMSLEEALDVAYDDDCDVIMLSDESNPPLVRICSISKYKYEQSRDNKADAKKQRDKQQEFKELKMTPRLASHDLKVRPTCTIPLLVMVLVSLPMPC
jgi:translation initiation factor IF-3